MKLEEQMLISAVRYALGRQSYIVKDTCDFVRLHRFELSENCRRIIIRDIDEALAMYHNLGETCGMECDERQWMRLLEVLVDELDG